MMMQMDWTSALLVISLVGGLVGGVLLASKSSRQSSWIDKVEPQHSRERPTS